MTLKEAAESMVVVVKGDLKLDYFKLWANGDELLHEVEKEGFFRLAASLRELAVSYELYAKKEEKRNPFDL